MKSRQRMARRKQHVSRHGNAAPHGAHYSRRRLRLRTRLVRLGIWAFLILFALSVLGIAVINIRPH